MPEIATHNHAYFDQSRAIFHQTAPVMKLRDSTAVAAHLAVTGVLNSSTALFWLKQVCFNKGAGEDEERDRFVYAARKLEQFPIAHSLFATSEMGCGPGATRLLRLSVGCVKRGQLAAALLMRNLFEQVGEAYDGWNRALPSYTPSHPVISQPFDSTQELLAFKAKAKEERERLRREMIAIQEEIDWLVYATYGLLSEDHPAVGLGAMDAGHPWEVALGQRPFELLAIHSGPPADWDESRKKLWQARTETIRTDEHIARIEQPMYKRRWAPPDYEKEFAEAFKWWLREKAEFYLEHAADGGPVSLKEWAAALWKDSRVRAAAEVYHGGTLLGARHFEPILKEAVEEETVPDDETAFKARHKQLRGKLNVPRERFRSLTATPGHYIWAGK